VSTLKSARNVQLNPSSVLNHTNKKWFKNLSSKEISANVLNLLQLGEEFSLSIGRDKKYLMIEFIKDFEGNDLHNNNNNNNSHRSLLRNKVIFQSIRFVDNK